MVYRENIRTTCLIITRSTIWIAIKPSRCDWRSILLKVEDVDDWPRLCTWAFLNPYLLGEVRLYDDANVKEALNKVLWKTISTLTAYELALKYFADFVESWGPFFDTPLMKDLDLLPYEWWDLIGTSGHTFAPIAHHILTQVCSTSSYEWNWNSYSFVYNKVQNQLTSNWVEDLLYIYTNSNLLQKWHGANPMAWYKKNMLFKDLISNVDENANESDSSGENPIALDEPYEDY